MLQELTLAMYLATGTATALDIHTTQKAITRGAREANPVMRYFIANKTSAYLFTGALGVASVESSLALRRQRSKAWWVPFVVNVGVHTAAAWSNRRIR